MGHVFLWKGGNGTLSLAADWTDETAGIPAVAAPGTGDSAALVGAGTGLVLAAGTLDVAALVALEGVALSGAVTAASFLAAGTQVIEAGATLNAGTANATGALDADGAGAALRVTGTLSVGGDVDATNAGAITAAAIALTGGTLSVDALSSAVIGGGTAAAGTVTVAAGATLSGAGVVQALAGGIAVAGTLAAASGTLTLFGSVSGHGTLGIDADATLFAAEAVGTGPTVAFEGSAATLELFTAAASLAASMSGFAVGDAIDVAASTIETAAWAHGVLTLTDISGTALALTLPDSTGHTYDSGIFVPLPDGFGGTEVLLAPVAVVPPDANITFTVPAGTSEAFGSAFGAVTTLVVGGLLVVEQHTGFQVASITGTVAAVGTAGFFSGTTATVSGGLLAAVGAHATALVRGDLLLAGTLSASDGGWDDAYTISLAGGVLTLDAASSITTGTEAAEAGKVGIPAGSTLSGWGRIEAPVDDAGLLLAQGGALTLGAADTGAGSVQIGAAATLDVLGPLALPVQFGAGATLALVASPSLLTGTLSGFAAGDVLDVTGTTIGSATWAGGTLTLSDGGATVGTLVLAGSFAALGFTTAADGSGGTLVTLGAGGSAAPLSVAGTLAVTAEIAAPGATAETGALVQMRGGTLDVGTLTVAAGAMVAGAGAIVGAVADAGTLTASGGALTVTGLISGSGSIGIGATGTLSALAGFAATSDVAFQGAGGTLILFNGAAGGPALIFGFSAGDDIDIAATVLGATWTATGSGSGTLDLTGTSGDLGSLTLAGEFSGDAFLAIRTASAGRRFRC